MQRRRYGLGGSPSALFWTLGFAVASACNVYDPSLLTGGSEGQGGTSSAGDGSGGDSGTGQGGTNGGTGGTDEGGTSGTNGGGGTGGSGGSGDTGGTGTGGSKGGSSGTTGGAGKGGTSTGGKGGSAGDAGSGVGGNAGSGTGGNGGSGTTGGAGSGTTGGSAGSASGGDAGSGGACGVCGCGKADTPDTDNDGVLDCVDICADYPDADCTVLKNGLVHRYSFNGTGTAVMDTKGTAHGTAMGVNAALSGSGTIVLTGGVDPASDPNKQYVDLPDDLLNGLTNATFEAWVTWPATGLIWQRIFDFGTTGASASGSYIFLATKVSNTTNMGFCRVATSPAGFNGETVAGGARANGPQLMAGAHHFVVIVDDTNDQISLYVDGALGTSVGFTGMLSAINDVNNWLGRSNYASDPYLGGTFEEFRIYNIALTVGQLRTSRGVGPNAMFF